MQTVVSRRALPLPRDELRLEVSQRRQHAWVVARFVPLEHIGRDRCASLHQVRDDVVVLRSRLSAPPCESPRERRRTPRGVDRVDIRAVFQERHDDIEMALERRDVKCGMPVTETTDLGVDMYTVL